MLTFGFLTFSGGIEMRHWTKMGQLNRTIKYKKIVKPVLWVVIENFRSNTVSANTNYTGIHCVLGHISIESFFETATLNVGPLKHF